MAAFPSKDAHTTCQSQALAHSTMSSNQQQKQLDSDISQLNLNGTNGSSANT